MIPLKEVNVLDINASYLGIPTSSLMENAGKCVAKTALEKFEIEGKKVVVICGPGNNGGDGFVAARYLAEKCRVLVILAKPEDKIRSEISKANFNKIKGKVGIIDTSELESKIKDAELIIDSMLGIGISGEIREPYLSCIQALNGFIVHFDITINDITVIKVYHTGYGAEKGRLSRAVGPNDDQDLSVVHSDGDAVQDRDNIMIDDAKVFYAEHNLNPLDPDFPKEPVRPDQKHDQEQ